MKTENLIERSWYLKDEPILTEAVFKRDHSDPWIERYKTGHAIYLEGENNELTMLMSTMSTAEHVEAGCFDVFRSYLKHFDTTRFMEVLYAIDTYYMNWLCVVGFENRPQLPEIKNDFKYKRIVDNLLNDSRGVLLWNHQLENFYLFLDGNREEAIKFRKGISCKKKAACLDIASNIRIDVNTTLKDVIVERMFFPFTTQAHFEGARDLYQYLNED